MDDAAIRAEDDDASPPALWAAAAHVFDYLVAIFGGAVGVVRMGMITVKERAEILGWLRPVEDAARLLLLLEALRLAPGLAEPPARARAPKRARARTRRLVEQDPEDSSGWAVGFAVLPRRSRRSGRKGGGSGDRSGKPGPGVFDPWPIAERIEAAARVLADPAPYAARLARRLVKRPELARRIARPHVPGPRPRLGDWMLGHAAAQAQAAVAAFDTS